VRDKVGEQARDKARDQLKGNRDQARDMRVLLEVRLSERLLFM